MFDPLKSREKAINPIYSKQLNFQSFTSVSCLPKRFVVVTVVLTTFIPASVTS